MFKRLTLIVTALCLVFTLAACSNILDQVIDDGAPAFSMGEVSGNTYSNSFLGLSCTLPDHWVFYTEEEILEMNDLAGSFMDEQTKETLANANLVYDMAAQYLEEGSSINVNMEKLSAAQLLSLDIQATLEAQIPGIETAFDNMGYTDIQVAYEKITLDGKEFDALRTTATIATLDYVSVCLCFRRGSHLASVNVGTLNTEALDTILGYITIQ